MTDLHTIAAYLICVEILLAKLRPVLALLECIVLPALPVLLGCVGFVNRV
jgi:hypothetical protein